VQCSAFLTIGDKTMSRCETVVIDRDGSPVVINKSDLQKTDKLYSDKPAKVEPKAAKKGVK
jgi:hypothetical protein